MIQETVDKIIKFIDQNAYFNAPYLDFIGVYLVGQDWKHFKEGDRIVLLKAYARNEEYFIINKVGGDIRLTFTDGIVNKPLLIPENLKFYLGGLND